MSEWTPPEVWVVFKPPSSGPIDVMSNDCLDEDGEVRDDCVTPGEEVVPYVPESVVDALREENARLKAKGLDDFTVTGDEYDRLLAERDALREENARLTRERDAARSLLRTTFDALHESGVSQEPRPDTDEDTWLASLDEWDRKDAEEALSMIRCPYYEGTGICTSGCRTEPACLTGSPSEGWEGVLERLGRPDTDETCPDCDGEGRESVGRSRPRAFVDDSCESCGGSGRVPTKEET